MFFAAAVLFASVGAHADSLEEKATKFVDALEAGNMAVVETMVGEDIVFEDPTWSPQQTKGRQNVLNLYRGDTTGAPKLSRYTAETFESNGTVVLSAVYYVEIEAETKPGTTALVPVMGRGLKVITFKDGSIVRHIDLADYARVNAAIAAAQKAKAVQK